MPRYMTTINPTSSAILVIDMTNGFLEPGAVDYVPSGQGLVPLLDQFLTQCRQYGIQIFYTSLEYQPDQSNMNHIVRMDQEKRGPHLIAGSHETEIYPGCAPKAGDKIIRRNNYSAFANTQLDQLLRYNGIDLIAIAGVCTDVACFATARDAMYRNYDVALLSDLTATVAWPDAGFGTVSEEEYRIAAMNNMSQTNCDVMESKRFLSMIHIG